MGMPCPMLRSCAQGQEVRTLRAHGGRVGALAWGGPLLASGSWDRTIRLADVRAPGCGACIGSHASEVCGLKARTQPWACSRALIWIKACVKSIENIPELRMRAQPSACRRWAVAYQYHA